MSLLVKGINTHLHNYLVVCIFVYTLLKDMRSNCLLALRHFCELFYAGIACVELQIGDHLLVIAHCLRGIWVVFWFVRNATVFQFL